MKNYSDVFGPIFLYWIAQLHDKLAFMNDTRSRKVLYCARAGKRIEDLMDAYTGGHTPFKSELFGISRIAACKVGAVSEGAFQTTFDVTAESLRNVSLAEVCKAYLQHSWDETQPQMKDLSKLGQPFDRDNFRTLLAANDRSSLWFRKKLEENREGLRTWLTQELNDHEGYILVDSGWKGSIQKILEQVYPEFGFEGMYFGVMDSEWRADRYGVVFDAPAYQPHRPETVFATHRHLIETLLEPNAPSVEDIIGGPDDILARAQIQAVRDEIPDPDQDALFISVCDYIAANARRPIDEITVDYWKALGQVKNLMLFPDRQDAKALSCKNRSIDFGRQGEVPILASSNHTQDTVEKRIERSLWPQGQIAIEHDDPKEVRSLQESVNGIKKKADYFASHEKAAYKSKTTTKPKGWSGSVAVVTRTKNRPLLFERAARSVANQTYQNLQWVIVNDGGDVDPVIEIIEQSTVDVRRISLVSNEYSVGMEAASNMGVRAVDTEFVVIHDDDDAWDPEFLSESIAFLQSARAVSADFQGVVSRAWRVSEEILGDSVIIHKTEPFMTWVSQVALSQMAVGNFFAPISFVYRRQVYDDIGGYDESLPVLGDWRFNLDFLAQKGIGFLDKYLAYYHHRDVTESSGSETYSNSVVGGQSLHAQYFSVVTDAIIRDPKTPASLAAVMVAGHQQRVFEHRQNLQDAKLNKLEHDLGIGYSQNRYIIEILEDRQTVETPSVPAQTKKFPETDAQHIRASVAASIAKKSPQLRLFLTLLWRLRLKNLESSATRQQWLSRILNIIPSPEDFDHISYLRNNPDIWATKFNGPEECLPYHHYILEGFDQGINRPTK